MDPALELRMMNDAGVELPVPDAMRYLEQSPLVQELTRESFETPLAMVWRLIACSEIPFIGHLAYTRQLMKRVLDTMWTGSAFSLDGTDAAVLPCYHAMILRSLIRLGFRDEILDQGIDWILRFQPFKRNEASAWKGRGIEKYGGCYKSTPCYIGVVKSAKALVDYQRIKPREAVQKRIDIALDYLLDHRLVYRLSQDQPITGHILDLSFPESYQLNIVELLLLMHETGRMHDHRTADALQFVLSKRTRDGYWKVDHVYQAKGYISFDRRGARADWLTYLQGRLH